MHIFILPRTPCRPSDPLSYLFFASSDPLYRYRPDPLSDFRRTPGGWGNPPPRAHLCRVGEGIYSFRVGGRVLSSKRPE